MIRKERETARSHGLTIMALTGDQITPDHIAAMWAFYQDTGSRKWGTPYLTRAFFDSLSTTLRDDILLVLAFDGTRAVAGALNFIGQDTLYGRYWGCAADYPCLHFELCYYQAMDYAIGHGLRVEAGAQGEHKLARGYLPTPVYSLHYLTDPGFEKAVARYLDEERRAVDEEIEVLTSYGPFRKTAFSDQD
jgi:predicted N-acyltransferase